MDRTRGAGCPWHFPSNLPYVQWHAEAEQRGRRGERQARCPDCSLWLWPEEMGEKP